MSYFPDLHASSLVGGGEHHRAIGWLSPEYPYNRGSVGDDTLLLLRQHIDTAFQPMAFAGWHDCEFCSASRGYGNLWIPTADRIDVAPEMIVHYIADHDYSPPAEFVHALRECPPQSSPEYMALFANYYSYFRVTPSDERPTPEQQSALARLLERGLADTAQMCREGDADGAARMADACRELTRALHGWGVWYRHLFVRLVRNSRDQCPVLDDYLIQYNEIFGEDTDPDAKE